VRILSIFQGKFIPLEIVVNMIFNLIEEFRKEPKNSKKFMSIVEVILDEVPWGFFDGASQGQPPGEGPEN
jgi:hypothetical protein